MELSFTQNGYFSLKNRQHLFLVVQNASRCFGTKGENHSKNSGGNQKMTPTPTRILQDPPWCSRKCIELAKITYFTAYRRTLNPVKRPNWPVFVSNLWIEVIITCDLQYFCSNIFIAEKFGERPLTVPCKLQDSQPNKGLFLMGEATFNVDAQNQKSWLRLPLVGYWTDGLAGCGELLSAVVVSGDGGLVAFDYKEAVFCDSSNVKIPLDVLYIAELFGWACALLEMCVSTA